MNFNICCDRCGMLYVENFEAHLRSYINGKHINLCPECQEKLDKFMKMEEEENVRTEK